MNALTVMSLSWGVITVAFAVLLIYRRSLTKGESDWISMTEDAKEESAIENQKKIEAKTNKLTIPIRALGTVSVLLLVVIVGFWLFHTLFTPPPMPQ